MCYKVQKLASTLIIDVYCQLMEVRFLHFCCKSAAVCYFFDFTIPFTRHCAYTFPHSLVKRCGTREVCMLRNLK